MINSKSRSKSQILRISAALLLIILVSSCNGNAINGQQGQVSFSYITGNSYSDLTNNVNIIVIGEMVAVRDNVNIARDDEDMMKSSSSRYEIGQVYEFKVDEYIKGNGKSTIYVVQVEGFLSQKELKTNKSITRAKENFDFIPIKSEKKYLLFLSDLIGFPTGEYFIGPIHPWRFDITDPEQVIPESPWPYANQVFPPVPLKLVLEQIKHPESDIIPKTKGDAYPAPNIILPEDKENPYPPPTEIP